MADPNIQFDFGVFEMKQNSDTEHDGQDTFQEECTHLVSECQSIKRIIVGLVYYQLMNDYKTLNVFSDFLSEKYGDYLDDIIHLHTKHADNLESINELLLKHPQYSGAPLPIDIMIDIIRMQMKKNVIAYQSV